jgi:hypothetical protein
MVTEIKTSFWKKVRSKSHNACDKFTYNYRPFMPGAYQVQWDTKVFNESTLHNASSSPCNADTEKESFNSLLARYFGGLQFEQFDYDGTAVFTKDGETVILSPENKG